MTVNPLFDIIMNEQDIEMFMKAFDDFMQQSETAIEDKSIVKRQGCLRT